MITGNVKEKSEKGSFQKKVGFFVGKVISVNPDNEWLESKGYELKEGSKMTQYLNEKEGVTTLRLDFYLEEESSKQLMKVSYYLEDRDKIKKDGSKQQYINEQGNSTWSDTEENLPSWFTKSEYRIAKVGEANLYDFLKTWLDDLNFADPNTVLHLDWKKLMNGNVREISEQINGAYSKPVVLNSVIQTKETDDGVVEYQKVYNGAVTQEYNMKYLRTKSFTEDYIEKIKSAKPRDLKSFEKFIKNIVDDQYGCKDFFSLKPLHDYDPKENIVGKREISPEDSDY